MGQGQVADAQAREDIQRAQIAFNFVAALDAQQDGNFAFPVQALDVVRRGGQSQRVRMARDLFVSHVDQVERTMDQVLLRPSDIYPDGEELGAQVPGAHLGDADHVRAGGISEVVTFVEHQLGRVRVCVNDDGAFQRACRNLLWAGGWPGNSRVQTRAAEQK